MSDTSLDGLDAFVGSSRPEVGTEPLGLTASPMEVATALSDTRGFAFLDSESVSAGPRRYSIVGWEPQLTFVSAGSEITLEHGGKRYYLRGSPLSILESLMARLRIDGQAPADPPFAGGAVGYLGYDLYSYIEHYDRRLATDDLQLPDCRLAFYDTLLVFDHTARMWHFAGSSIMSGKSDLHQLFEAKWRQLGERLDVGGRHVGGRRRAGLEDALPTSLVRPDGRPAVEQLGEAISNGSIGANMTRDEYLDSVRRAKEHIYAGDVYQLNFTQRFDTALRQPPFELFRALRTISPSSYGACLLYGGHAVVSSSPELFLYRDGYDIVTRPIKGTRPRGSTEAKDRGYREALESSEKDAAELSMIVDLSRNDLGRVCKYGSVRIEGHRRVEVLPTVFHTNTTVRGTLRHGVSAVELLRAAFPAGSVTGCPKIRAIELIDELEPTCRNVYTGSIGWLGYDGNLALNVAIRTMIVKNGRVYYQVGGGIVADSEPEDEYAESLDKALAMHRAAQQLRPSDE
jgi:para-aminobenzoate synthetase component 1